LDASSYTSLEVLNLAGCSDFGKDQTTSLLLPDSPNLKDVDLTNTSVQSAELGNVLSDLDSTPTTDGVVKKFRYLGTSRRPSESDDNITNLESTGWDISPKEPTQDKFVDVQPTVKPDITRQDLFEKSEVNLLFSDTQGQLNLGGSEISLEGQPGTSFKFADVLWLESEIGRTKRVNIGGDKVALVTWFGYGSNSVQIKSFEVSLPDCMPSFLEPDVDGEPLGSVGYQLKIDELAFDADLSVGQPNKYITFTNSIGNSFIPSETTPFGFGVAQKYRFDLSDISQSDAVKFRAWKADLDSKTNTELQLPITLSDQTLEIQETTGYYGGDVVIGPVSNDTEWITLELADGTELADIGYGRQFQVSRKCAYIPPPPTPTPTPTSTPTPTPVPTPTPYYYSGENFSLLFKESGVVSSQKYGSRIKCSADGSRFILISNPYKGGKFTTELSFFKLNAEGVYEKLNQIVSERDGEAFLVDPEISGDGSLVTIGNPGFTIMNNIGSSDVETIPFAGSLTTYEYESSVNRYITDGRILSNTPGAFSRLGTSHKIDATGDVLVIKRTFSGNNEYEIYSKNVGEFQLNGIVTDGAFLGNGRDLTADKLHSKFALSNDGSTMIVPVLGGSDLAIVDIEDATAMTTISLPQTTDKIVSLETNDDASKFVIRMDNTFYAYSIFGNATNLDYQTTDSEFIGTEYKLSADGNRLAISNPDINDGRGVVTIYQKTDTGYTFVTQIQNTNGQPQDKFGSSIDFSSNGELLFTSSPYADTNNRTDAGRFSVFRIEYPESTPTPTPTPTETPTPTPTITPEPQILYSFYVTESGDYDSAGDFIGGPYIKQSGADIYIKSDGSATIGKTGFGSIYGASRVGINGSTNTGFLKIDGTETYDKGWSFGSFVY